MRRIFSQHSTRLSRRTRGLATAAAAAAALALVPGCLLTSGQILVSFDLDNPLVLPSVNAAIPQPIDLNDIEDYADHKDKLDDLADLALLGEVENSGSSSSTIEFWMTPEIPAIPHLTASGVRNDPTAVLVWGPFTSAAGETRKINWDDSSALFSGRQALLNEVRGDGQFMLYLVSSTTATTATFNVNNGVLVLVLDAGL